MARLFRSGDKRDIVVTKWELEYVDVFHFKNFYKATHDFLEQEGWVDPEDDGINWEYLYFERVIPPSGIKEHRTWWRMQIVPNNSSYVRYLMKVEYRGLYMQPIEVMLDGKKYKTWKGDITIYCEAILQLDYQNKWKKHWFLKHFDEFFRNRIYKPYWEAHKLELYKKSYQFNREVKKFLQMKSPMKEPTTFRGPKGIPT